MKLTYSDNYLCNQIDELILLYSLKNLKQVAVIKFTNNVDVRRRVKCFDQIRSKVSREMLQIAPFIQDILQKRLLHADKLFGVNFHCVLNVGQFVLCRKDVPVVVRQDNLCKFIILLFLEIFRLRI
jgi:hypothetical protein